MKQLELGLTARRAPSRTLAPLERLQLVLRRRGIDPQWRRYPGTVTRYWILPLVGLDPGDRLRTEPRSDATGLPVQGCWETLCAWHVNQAKHCPEERYAYNERSTAA